MGHNFIVAIGCCPSFILTHICLLVSLSDQLINLAGPPLIFVMGRVVPD